MKKWTKILSVVMAVLVILTVTLVVLANVLITSERVKEALLPLAEENLNRKIDLGDINVSLFSGIEINGLTVYEQDEQEIFIATDLVRLRYQLLPLLAMKVVVDEVRLEKPTIRLVRFHDGQFNFSDLMVSSADQTKKTVQTENQNAVENEGSALISLLVSNVLLQDGRLVFLDHVLNNNAPYRYEISNLQNCSKRGVVFRQSTSDLAVPIQRQPPCS